MRQTGRTHRYILKSLLAASEGQDVIFICPTIEARDQTFYRAYLMVVKDVGAVKIGFQNKTISYPSGGTLRFFVNKPRIEDSLRGLGSNVIRDI